MHILHYTLGFQPYRSGGLVRYATDLMQMQASMGHKIFALYPGSMSLTMPKCHIRSDESIGDVCVFELVNSKPVPLMYGVKNVNDFIDDHNVDVTSLNKMLEETQPDIFHIHTLMGLPLEFLKVIKRRGIKTVYTSHDYFGLCPRVNFIDNNGQFCSIASAQNCCACNVDAKKTIFLRVRNAKCLVPLKQFLRKAVK